MKNEKNYDFRKRMLQVHEKDIRDINAAPNSDDFIICEGITIGISENAGDVILTAAKDFIDFLFTSMNIPAMLKKSYANADITIALASDEKMGEYAAYKGYRVEVSNKIKIYGFDERGAAAALYFLEDFMALRKAPYIKQGIYNRKSMYSPTMVHSGYGLDQYPNEHLAKIAHEGRDAILVFTKDVDKTPYGYLDFNELIYRAAKYGIDVYAYSYLRSGVHPDEPNAEEFYEASYGKLFKNCPGLKGVTLVGESVEFPSKDKNVTGKRHTDNVVENIPTGKVSPGWYPCFDYPVWLNLLKKIIRRHKPDADIVFWTYNWGHQPEEARVKLIKSLPADISLQATFEMFEPRKIGDITEQCADYTLSFAGPGKYFESEAKAASERGIRLYSMTNTGGLTWDIGVIPYEPMPHQWIKRYKAMENAHDEWGLCGIMETHHYGFYPSFISKLSKYVMSEPRIQPEIILEKVVESEFGKQNTETVIECLRLWSEAITHYTPTNSDQYGAFRIGPSYPLNLWGGIKRDAMPYAMFGNRIWCADYLEAISKKDTFTTLRLPEEIRSLEKMKALTDKGIALLAEIPDKNEKLLRLFNMGKFISNCVLTGINSKKWCILKNKVKSAASREEILTIVDELEALARLEIKNAEDTIPLVQADSRLGWEPSMEYMTDEDCLRWKIRQVNYIINVSLDTYRAAARK